MSKIGRWAGGLLAAFLVFLVTLIVLLNLAGYKAGSPQLIIVGICASISGIAAFITGMVSLIKFKDRSFVVVLAVIIGSIAVLITIMEVIEAIL
jgi:fluoride ion exporter CrcB/FEX